MQIKVEQLDQRNIGQVITVESEKDGLPSRVTGLLEAVESNDKTGVYLTVASDEFHFDRGETVDIRRGVELGAMTQLSDDVEEIAETIDALMEGSRIAHLALQRLIAAESARATMSDESAHPAT